MSKSCAKGEEAISFVAVSTLVLDLGHGQKVALAGRVWARHAAAMDSTRGADRPRPNTRLHELEFRVLKALQSISSLASAKILVACSGGADSIACLEVLARIRTRLGVQLAVASVHHGRSDSIGVWDARNSALQIVREAAHRVGLEFYTFIRSADEPILESEAALRDFRHSALKSLAQEHKCNFIAFAHHADDLFETRLIRLVRGTGMQGLEAMSLEKGEILRPLLNETREHLRDYAVSRKLIWQEDPSNADRTPLRNWIRLEWLPALEEKRRGSVAAFARSLDHLVQTEKISGQLPSQNKQADAITFQKNDRRIEFSRDEFSELKKTEQCSRMAAYLLSMDIRDFSSSHISEIIKRLSSRQSKKFKILGISWQINAGQVIGVLIDPK